MYRFQTLNTCFLYTPSDQIFVNRLAQQNPNVWDGSMPAPDFARTSRTRRDNLKIYINEQLNNIQNPYCIYCGLLFNENAQREHILPKETYPQYAFEPQNLVLACARCNGFQYKHTKDYAIPPVDLIDYASNEFEIIHPYLDNIHEHLDTSNVVIRIINSSAKGYKTRDEFDLNNEYNISYRSTLASNRDGMLLNILNGNYLYS